VSESFGFVSVENLPPVQPVKFSDRLLPDDYNRTLSICAAATSFPLPSRRLPRTENRRNNQSFNGCPYSSAGTQPEPCRIRRALSHGAVDTGAGFIRSIAESGGFQNPVSAI
jgi:hypothetical protein